MIKRALITGITGMDGSHLAEFLLSKGYEVFGLERRASTKNRINLKKIEDRITFIPGDLTDQNSLLRALEISDPHEIYNLAAQSCVAESWNTPISTSDITGLGALRLLEAIREKNPSIKFYQASSSEMFGKMSGVANESTIFYPRSPYGVAKCYAHWMTKNYRESYGIFACCGILFNHESERRGFEFVTRKITDGVAQIKLGIRDKIELGNLDARRDWGYAPEYVEAMWLMLQQEEPNDFVIATNTSYSIREFLDQAFGLIGIDDWTEYVVSTKENLRPAEVEYLRGDCSFAKEKLGWEPKTSLTELVEKMLTNDLALWMERLQ